MCSGVDDLSGAIRKNLKMIVNDVSQDQKQRFCHAEISGPYEATGISSACCKGREEALLWVS